VTTHPERAGQESGQESYESCILSFRRNAFVDTVSEPDIGVHIPAIEQHFEAWCKLDVHNLHVGRAIPQSLACFRVSVEAKTREDRSTLEKVVIWYDKRWWEGTTTDLGK